jgi:hypothetical protein
MIPKVKGRGRLAYAILKSMGIQMESAWNLAQKKVDY